MALLALFVHWSVDLLWGYGTWPIHLQLRLLLLCSTVAPPVGRSRMIDVVLGCALIFVCNCPRPVTKDGDQEVGLRILDEIVVYAVIRWR